MRTSTVVATAAVSMLVSAGVAHQTGALPGQADEARPSAAPVELAVAPQQLEVLAGLPCLPHPAMNVSLTNQGAEPVFADSFLTADEPLELSRPSFSSYLPPGQEVSVPFVVTAPHGTAPGTYEVTGELLQRLPRGDTVTARVEVTAPPPKTPGSNVLLGERATPSSSYVTASTAFNPCGAVDGDRTWSHATAWNSANSGVFPSTYEVTLPEPRTMNRVDLYTSQSASSTPERHGLRDWDVEVLVNGSWRTVAQVRGNTQLVVSSVFEPVETTALRVVALASNDGKYARIAELEAYYDVPEQP
ncbi:discoidin domain-containing protein [Jiangella asiatica]|uniref:Discoidin domain-containing protein n=1 Tax=Jiangella asiatica TaxID=2530372 RepID=A0A4R5DRV5_9ACTN|nr:discoidin domain-containing protein [Jiangella asiatica]TDE15054.1 discoidin domain-containing protein [Jiangella asiatica]